MSVGFLLWYIRSVGRSGWILSLSLNIHSLLPTQQTDGALGAGSWDFAGSLFEDEVRIVGDKGHMAFAVFDNGPVKLVLTTGKEEEEVLLGPFGEETSRHVHLPLVRAVVRDLQGFFGGEGTWTVEDEAAAHCRSTGSSALRTSAAMDAVLAEYYGGGREDAFWRRPETWATGRDGKS